MAKMDQWTLRRLRMVIWKRWQKVRTWCSWAQEIGSQTKERYEIGRTQEKATDDLPVAIF